MKISEMVEGIEIALRGIGKELKTIGYILIFFSGITAGHFYMVDFPTHHRDEENISIREDAKSLREQNVSLLTDLAKSHENEKALREQIAEFLKKNPPAKKPAPKSADEIGD